MIRLFSCFLLTTSVFADVSVFREGAPAVCGAETAIRYRGEKPVVDVTPGKESTLFVQAVSSQIRSFGVDENEILKIRAQIQLLSCVGESAKTAAWVYENPDKEDWAQMSIATSLFNGPSIRSPLYFVNIINLNTNGVESRLMANFEIPLKDAVSVKNLERFRKGKKIKVEIKLSYHYEKQFSDARPAIPMYEMGRFPVRIVYTLPLVKM